MKIYLISTFIVSTYQMSEFVKLINGSAISFWSFELLKVVQHHSLRENCDECDITIQFNNPEYVIGVYHGIFGSL